MPVAGNGPPPAEALVVGVLVIDAVAEAVHRLLGRVLHGHQRHGVHGRAGVAPVVGDGLDAVVVHLVLGHGAGLGHGCNETLVIIINSADPLTVDTKHFKAYEIWIPWTYT